MWWLKERNRLLVLQAARVAERAVRREQARGREELAISDLNANIFALAEY